MKTAWPVRVHVSFHDAPRELVMYLPEVPRVGDHVHYDYEGLCFDEQGPVQAPLHAVVRSVHFHRNFVSIWTDRP